MSASLAKKFREVVLQILYSKDLGGNSFEELAEIFMQELKITEKQIHLAHQKAMEIMQVSSLLDEKIKAVSISYELDRIGKVEKNILRLALWELLENSLAPEVIISEAIRLTKKFSSDSSVSFVTALLNGVPRDASIPSS